MDMRMRVASSRAWLHDLVERHDGGETGDRSGWPSSAC